MKIYSRYDKTKVLFEDDNATMAKTVVAAVKSGADLFGANLSSADLYGADLSYANLSGVDLSYADLCRVNLHGANLNGAILSGAYLCRVNLHGANLNGAILSGAYLYGADLSYIDMSGANLYGADLSYVDLNGTNLYRTNLYRTNLKGVDLSGANLTDIKEDLWKVLSHTQNEVSGLLAALREGRVDGNLYEGECACLVGTIANVASKHYTELEGIKPNSSRPAERWFFGISKGDTPESNPIVKITVDWIEEFQKL